MSKYAVGVNKQFLLPIKYWQFIGGVSPSSYILLTSIQRRQLGWFSVTNEIPEWQVLRYAKFCLRFYIGLHAHKKM